MNRVSSDAVFLIVAGVLLLGWELVGGRRRRRALDRIAQRVGARSDGAWMTASAGLVAYHYDYTEGTRRHPSALTLRLPAAWPGAFGLVRETAADRAAKRLGLARELQLGDPSVDAAWYLPTEDRRVVEWLQASEVRDALRELARLGVVEIVADGRWITAIWRPCRLSEFDAERLPRAATQAATIARALPTTAGPIARPVATTGWKPEWIVTGVPFVAMVAAPLMVGLGLYPHPPLDQQAILWQGLLHGVLALLAYAAASLWLLRTRAAGHRTLGRVALLACISVPYSVLGVEIGGNQWLDRAAPNTHVARVVGHYVVRGRRGAQHGYLQVLSWRPGRTIEEVGCSWAVFEAVRPMEQDVAVVTKPGRFGFEWVVDVRPQASTPASVAAGTDRFALAQQAAASGRFDEAIGLCRDVLAQEPERFDVMAQLGRWLHDRGVSTEALGYARRAAQEAEDPATIRQAEALLQVLGDPPASVPALASVVPSVSAWELILVRVGPVNEWLLRDARPQLEAALRLRCRIDDGMVDVGRVDRVPWPGAWQMDAGRLILALHRRFPLQARRRHLGVTEADLFASNKNFVFGATGEQIGIVSYRRFLAATTGEPPNRPRLVVRFVKQAISSACFTLGIPRCQTPGCVRAYPNTLAEHDRKGAELCPVCRRRLAEVLASSDRRPSTSP